MNNSRKILTGIMSLSILLGLSGCSSSNSASVGSKDANSNSGENVTLTYWSWGESDIPGFDKWLQKEVENYQNQHKNITIKVVTQNSDTLTGSFQTAAQSNSGPDIATLWATMPVLSQAWSGAAAPISDFVKSDELNHWLLTSENQYDGKVWGMPIYVIGVPLVYNKDLFKQAGLDPNNPPKTWDEFLKDCEQLKTHGITPLGMGNKDGLMGAWMFSVLGVQNLDTIDQLKQAILGNEKFSDPKYSEWLSKFSGLVDKGYFNNDISSLDLNNGWNLFPQGKAAMSWTTDGNFISWLKQMGGDAHIGVMKTPTFGSGKLANSYDATQSSTAFITSWSKHKEQAAAFLQFLHSKEAMTDWYSMTGAFPADNRFDSSLITDEEVKQIWQWDTQKDQVWPENYLPPMVDQNADMDGGGTITSKSGTPQKAAELWNSVLSQWKTQHPDELANYTKWTK